MRLTFFGGAGTVTGSRHLLETDTRRFLIDAGLFQGLKKLRQRNWSDPGFVPASIDRLLLTHIHIDHVGYLPRLVKLGLRCPVHCTKATKALAPILLHDSAKIQEEDAHYANRKGFSRHDPALPLYTQADVERTLELFRESEYDEWLELGPSTRARFRQAGHILGSAAIELEHSGRTVIFSGDVGRYAMPLHRDPDPLSPCDNLVIESTYGGRLHPPQSFEEQIRQPFLRTFEQGGVVLIPSFAVGRAQQVTLILRQMMDAGELPEVPIHIDSPMAIDATRIYSQFLDHHNLDDCLSEDGRSRLFPREVYFARHPGQSKEINHLKGPRVILSSSGMMTNGRILHHMSQRLPHPENLLCVVGYQAAGTRGRSILQGTKTVRIHGQDVPVRARILDIGGLSGHADHAELMRWLRSSERLPRRVFIVHGEPDSAEALRVAISRELKIEAQVADLFESVPLA